MWGVFSKNEISPNTAPVQAATIAELKDLMRRVSEPEGYIFVSQIDEAISIAEGETNHEVTSYSIQPSLGRISPGSGNILTLGAVTFESF